MKVLENGRQTQILNTSKNTSILWQSEEEHKVFVDRRQPQFCSRGKTISILYFLKLAMLATASTEIGTAQPQLGLLLL